MAKYIQLPNQSYVSTFVPQDLNFYQNQIDKQQSRYDATNLAYNQALSKLYEEPTLDFDIRDSKIKEIEDSFNNIYDKYHGDLSKANDDILSLISKAKSDKFWQLNKYKVEQANLAQKALMNGMLPVNDPTKVDIIDKNGNYANIENLRSEFVTQPKYYGIGEGFATQLVADVKKEVDADNITYYSKTGKYLTINQTQELTERKIREKAAKYEKAFSDLIGNAKYETDPELAKLYGNTKEARQARIDFLASLASSREFTDTQDNISKLNNDKNGNSNSGSNKVDYSGEFFNGTQPLPKGAKELDKDLRADELSSKLDVISSNLDKAQNDPVLQSLDTDHQKLYAGIQDNLSYLANNGINPEDLFTGNVSKDIKDKYQEQINTILKNTLDLIETNPEIFNVHHPLKGGVSAIKLKNYIVKDDNDNYVLKEPSRVLYRAHPDKYSYLKPPEVIKAIEEITKFDLIRPLIDNTDKSNEFVGMFDYLRDLGVDGTESINMLKDFIDKSTVKSQLYTNRNTTVQNTLKSNILNSVTPTPVESFFGDDIILEDGSTPEDLKKVISDKDNGIQSAGTSFVNGEVIITTNKGETLRVPAESLDDIPKAILKTTKGVFDAIQSLEPETTIPKWDDATKGFVEIKGKKYKPVFYVVKEIYNDVNNKKRLVPVIYDAFEADDGSILLNNIPEHPNGVISEQQFIDDHRRAFDIYYGQDPKDVQNKVYLDGRSTE